MKKRLLSLALTLALCMGLIPAAFAAGGQTQTVRFSDVLGNHWAYNYVQTCAGKGIVSGVDNGKFAPDGQVTYAQFCVMIINAFGSELLDRSVGGAWYTPYMNAARKGGLLAATAAAHSNSSADVPMNRYEMAQVAVNVLNRAGKYATSSNKAAAQMFISDWSSVPSSYEDAVSSCFFFGILTGYSDDSFGGSRTMTRAQACVVLTKLEEVIARKTEPQTAPPISTSSDLQPEVEFSPEYMSSKYYQQLKNVTLTGDYRKDIIAVASSQIGYCEGNREDQLDGSRAGYGNYTEYGRYLDSNGTAWCSEFASWCARMANVPTDILHSSWSANVEVFDAPYYSWSQTVYAGGSYTPQPGDLALFAWYGTSHTARSLSHTAIVYDVKTNGNTVTITVIDGNSSDAVRMHDYTADGSDGDVGKGHLVYFVAPDYDAAMG